MIYVKANVERIVSDPTEAKKLESQGFRRVDIEQPAEAPRESMKEQPVNAPEESVEGQPVEAPKRRRRKAK